MAKTGPEIQLLTEDKYDKWNDYVKSNPFGTIFHTTHWLKRVADEVLVYVLMDEAERILAGAALALTTKFRVKAFHLPPYTPYYGPLFGNKNTEPHYEGITRQQEFIEGLLKVLPSKGHYDFKMRANQMNPHAFHWNGFSIELTVTNIIEDKDEFERDLNKEYRRVIRKLSQELGQGNLIIEEIHDASEVIDLQIGLSEKKNFNPHLERLKIIMKDFDPSFMKATLLRSPELGVISGAIGVYDDKFYYNIINPSPRVEHQLYKKANLLLIYHLVMSNLEQGRRFDFEGSMLRGVEAFYRQLGGKQVPVYRFQKTYSWYFLMLRTAKFVKTNLKKV